MTTEVTEEHDAQTADDDAMTRALLALDEESDEPEKKPAKGKGKPPPEPEPDEDEDEDEEPEADAEDDDGEESESDEEEGDDSEDEDEPEDDEEKASKTWDKREWTKKFTALSRRKKDITRREQEHERSVSAFEIKSKELASREAEVAAILEGLKSNPLDTLEKLGASWDEVSVRALNGSKKSEADSDALKALKDEIAELKKRDEQRDLERQVAAAKAERVSAFNSQVETGKFPLVKRAIATGFLDLAKTGLEYLQAHWEETGGPNGGVELPPETVLEHIESHLKAQRTALLGASDDGEDEEAPKGPSRTGESDKPSRKRRKNRSLTNSNSQARSKATAQKLTDEDRMNAALAAISD